MRLIHFSAPLVVALVLVTATSAAHPAAQETNPSAAALVQFEKQIKAYMDLHKKEEAAVPDVKKNATPAEIVVFEKVLAERIRAARSAAKQGDVFSPEVVPVFKKIVTDYYRRRSGREKRLLFDEVPNFKPQVNMTYPVNAAKATFPPRLALALPQLQDELEYRLVATDLILRDTGANLIVDFISTILPAPTNQ